MSLGKLYLCETGITGRAPVELLRQLNAEIERNHPGRPVNDVDRDSFHQHGGLFVLATLDGEAAGCGALRRLSANTAEVKRMFVVPDYRGRGIAKAILAFLERAAADREYSRIRLETGNRLLQAIGLYRSAGYREIPPFGPYVGSNISVCFEKVLGGPGSPMDR